MEIKLDVIEIFWLQKCLILEVWKLGLQPPGLGKQERPFILRLVVLDRRPIRLCASSMANSESAQGQAENAYGIKSVPILCIKI